MADTIQQSVMWWPFKGWQKIAIMRNRLDEIGIKYEQFPCCISYKDGQIRFKVIFPDNVAATQAILVLF